MYDIWTFTDASSAKSFRTGFMTGTYGFCHMEYRNDGYLYPFQTRIFNAEADINSLELFAIHAALADIDQMFSGFRICIFTDSDTAVDTIFGYNTRDRKINYAGSQTSSMLNCVSMKHCIEIKRCKGHANFIQQQEYLRSIGDFTDEWYVHLVNQGNQYIDHLVSYSCKNYSSNMLKQNDNGLLVLSQSSQGQNTIFPFL